MSAVPAAPEPDAEPTAAAAERRALDAAVAVLAELDLASVGIEPGEDDWS